MANRLAKIKVSSNEVSKIGISGFGFSKFAWSLYLLLLVLLSAGQVGQVNMASSEQIVLSMVGKVFEFVALSGLLFSILNVRVGATWFWKVVNALLAVAVVTLVIFSIFIAIVVGGTVAWASIAGVVLLLPLQYRLTRYAYRDIPALPSPEFEAEQPKQECLS